MKNEYEGRRQVYFKTSDFYIAAFLFAKGHEIAGIDKTKPKRCVFAFIDTSDREGLIQAFNYSKEEDLQVMVDARKLIYAMKTLKEKIYQTI